MVSGTVPSGLFPFCVFCFSFFFLFRPPPAREEGRVVCLSWAHRPSSGLFILGGQPKHPKGTTNNGDPKGRGRQPANATLEPKWPLSQLPRHRSCERHTDGERRREGRSCCGPAKRELANGSSGPTTARAVKPAKGEGTARAEARTCRG